jgi:hypothetical protein
MGATVDHRDGVLDDPEAAAGDVRIRAHRRPLAQELVAYIWSASRTPRSNTCA